MRDTLSAALLHVHTVLADGGGSDSTFKVAIVTTAGVVIAAAITSYAATFQRNKAPDPPPTTPPAPAPTPTPAPDDALVTELRDRATRAESKVGDLETQHADDETEKERLENLLWSNKINPHTGDKIT